MPPRRGVLVPALVGLAALGAPPSAGALPACEPRPQPKVVASGQGTLESVASDAQGRLFYTDSAESQNGRLLRLDRPGAEPTVVREGIFEPGGLAFEPDGTLVMGYGNAAAQGIADNGQAGLVRVDPETGADRPFVDGLGMANGVARGADGTFYASNALGDDIDRVVNGKLEPDWAKLDTPNGLVIDSSGRYLYAAQTFKPASIARVELTDPPKVTTYVEAPADAATAALDGMTRDGADRLFVTANQAGEVWRVGTDKAICVLADGLKQPAAAAFGGGAAGFGARNLYVVTFSGDVVELAGATDRPPVGEPVPPRPERPKLRLTIRPREARAGRRHRFRFTVRAAGAPVRRARVRVAGRTVRTGRRGRAALRLRFRAPGRKRTVATRRGYRSAAAYIRVVRPAGS